MKANVKEVDSQQLVEMLNDKYSPVHLIDVRETFEWNEEHIPKATYLGRGCLERDIESFVPDVYDNIVLYCAGGVRSVLAADALLKMGYKNVYSLKGGIKGWKDNGNEINANMRAFSPRAENY